MAQPGAEIGRVPQRLIIYHELRPRKGVFYSRMQLSRLRVASSNLVAPTNKLKDLSQKTGCNHKPCRRLGFHNRIAQRLSPLLRRNAA